MSQIELPDCPFCLPRNEPQIVISDEFCYAMWTREGPEGSAMVLPRTHRATVFDLTAPPTSPYAAVVDAESFDRSVSRRDTDTPRSAQWHAE